MPDDALAYLEGKRLSNYIVPQIFHDELVHGYLARFALQNGLHNFKFTKLEVGYTFLGKSDFKPVREYLGVIEEITGYSAGYLIRQHTLNHLTRFKLTLFNNAPKTDNNLLSKKLLKDHLYFCEGCAKEDHQNLGMSYWRISHQLYSIDFCYKHHEWLSYVPLDSVYTLMPHQIPAVFPRSRYIDLCDLILNDDIQNYIAKVQQYRSECVILDMSCLQNHLRQKAESLNLQVSGSTGIISKLPEFLASIYPSPWLEKFFSNLSFTNNTSSKAIQRFGLSHDAKFFDINSILLVVSAIDPDIDLLEFDSQIEFKTSRFTRNKETSVLESYARIVQSAIQSTDNVLQLRNFGEV